MKLTNKKLGALSVPTYGGRLYVNVESGAYVELRDEDASDLQKDEALAAMVAAGEVVFGDEPTKTVEPAELPAPASINPLIVAARKARR
jgi:hypothetical protein